MNEGLDIRYISSLKEFYNDYIQRIDKYSTFL